MTNQASHHSDRTSTLIASDQVEGTSVYNHSGDKLGTIQNFMVDKQSGQAEYAVMSFGGFLGIGEDYHPIPWDMLNYNADQGGYVIDLDKDKLSGSPRYATHEDRDFSADYRTEVDSYYGIGR